MRRRSLKGAPSKPDSPAKGRYALFLGNCAEKQQVFAVGGGRNLVPYKGLGYQLDFFGKYYVHSLHHHGQGERKRPSEI